MRLSLLKSTGQSFHRTPLSLALSGVFSCLDSGHAFFSRYASEAMLLLSASYQEAPDFACFNIDDINFGHLVKVMSAMFLHCKIIVFSL